MNPLHQTPVHPRDPRSSADALDQKLRDFFRAEMPNPWPACQAPESPAKTVGHATVRRPLFRSRFALAASLLCLLAGHLVLSGMFSDYSPTPRNSTTEPSIGANPNSKLRKTIPPGPLDRKLHPLEGNSSTAR
jgi:hypothetical protein